MNDIQLTSSFKLDIQTRQRRIDVYLNDIVQNISLDNLGDPLLNNQILIKQLNPSYRKLHLQIAKDAEYLFDSHLNIVDRTVAPSDRIWILESEDSVYKIRKGLQGFYKGKWVLDENGIVTAHTLEQTNTDPWLAAWQSIHELYLGYSVIICERAIIPMWNVVPITSIVGELGSGAPGSIEWSVI